MRWPSPLLTALAAQEQFDRFAACLPDEKEEGIARQRFCQTLFYFGIRDLGAGRIVQAREKLCRALQVGMPQHPEYMLADASLQRLGP